MTIHINGIGLCSSKGSMMQELADAIGVALPVSDLDQSGVRKQLRGSGAFVIAGVKAAMEALHNSGLTDAELATTGIIVTSRIGDQNTTSEFIDDLIDFGINQGSPLKFAHSSHNAAASYIAKQFNIYGPAITAVNFEASFANGLTLARCWLEQKTCENVLLLQIESCSLLSEIIVNHEKNDIEQLVQAAEETTLFADSREKCVAACFLLGNNATNSNLGEQILLSRFELTGEIPAGAPVIETPLPEPVRLLTAILKP